MQSRQTGLWSLAVKLGVCAFAAALCGGMPAQAQNVPIPPPAQTRPASPPPQARPAAPLSQPAAPLSQPAAVPSAQADNPVTLSDGYVLGTGDVIEISLIGSDDYKARVQVQTDGTIQLPYINSLKVSDMTVLQLRDVVRDRLTAGGYYRDPAVSVIVANYASRYVVVLGQVSAPGVVPVDRAYRASEILARVGGTRETGADVLTLRRASGEELSLPIERIAVGGAADDPIVNPGDKLYVGLAATFYIYGQVNGAGTYKIAPGMDMRMALAQAGGLSERGSEKRIKLFRDGKEIKNRDMTMAVRGGDVIVVGERFF